MVCITDIILGIPLGIIYNILIRKLVEVLYSNTPVDIKSSKTILTYLGCAVLGLIMSRIIFGEDGVLENGIMYTGVIFGSIILLVLTIITDWDKMDNSIKLILFGMLFGLCVWFSYYLKRSNNRRVIASRKSKKKVLKLN